MMMHVALPVIAGKIIALVQRLFMIANLLAVRRCLLDATPAVVTEAGLIIRVNSYYNGLDWQLINLRI